MKRFVVMALSVVSTCVFAEQIPLWPEGKMPLQTKEPGPDKMAVITDDCIRLAEVTAPSLLPMIVKQPSDAESLPAVIVCPGGGYHHVTWEKEGTEIGRWLNTQNISAFILKYRVPGQPEGAYADAQRAVSLVRANAVRYKVNPNQIGIIGFSAGSHLAARVSANHKKRSYAPVDLNDSVSCRPDFTMLAYPWHVAKEIAGPDGKKTRVAEVADEFAVDATTPPAFVVQSCDDSCGAENALAWCNALQKNKVPAMLHVFPTGGHGYALRRLGNATDAWPSLAELWLVGLLGE